MDGTRFDAMARHLAAIGSRREAVNAIAAAGLGLGLAWLGLGGADAKKTRKKGKKRKKGARCLGLNRACGGDAECCGDQLVCDHVAYCDPIDALGNFQCCRPPGAPCNENNGCDCCGMGNCVGGKCCTPHGMPCEIDQDCCGDMYCDTTGIFSSCQDPDED